VNQKERDALNSAYFMLQVIERNGSFDTNDWYSKMLGIEAGMTPEAVHFGRHDAMVYCDTRRHRRDQIENLNKANGWNVAETSTNWILVDAASGKHILVGDTLTTFRGEKVKIESMRPPHKPSSSGHVTILHLSDDPKVIGAMIEVYPGVINAKFVQA
jgi:hypothetical protein